MKAYLVTLLLLPLFFASLSAQTLTFSCATQDETDQCNALNANAVSCQDDDVCIQCSFRCALVATLPPAGTECANTSCIQGLCSGYVLYQNISEYGYSCNDVYNDEYCEYCGACLGEFGGSNTSGNGTDGGVNSTCDSDYMHLFCRLLPYDFVTCGSNYGFTECLKCTSLDGELEGIQQVCPSLILGDATSEQLDIFCSSMSICDGLIRGPVCVGTDQDLDCKYCDYIDENMDVGLCVTEAPPIECESQNALACRLINSYNLTCGELLYHPDTCLGCEQYSACNPIPANIIEANQTDILCNGGLAENCSSALFSSNCTFAFSVQICDYCKLSDPICLYNGNNNGSMTECNSSPDDVMSCFVNVTYFPCRALYDSDYCAECETVLDACGVDPGSGFPSELCDNSDFIRACSLIANLPTEECNQHVSLFQCQICQAVNTTCPSVTGDYLCSNEVSCLCTAIVSPDDDGFCFEYASDNECAFCKANNYICSNDIDSNYNCIFNKSQCQDIYDSLTENDHCNSSYYSTLQCAYCISIAGIDSNGSGINSNVSGNNTKPIEGSGSTECVTEITQFCTSILLNSSCNIVKYGEDCSFCENYYLPVCPEVMGNQTFCSSSFNMLACSAIPLGPACDRDEHGFLCNLCTYFVENCTAEICSDEELIVSCQNILIEGSTPSLEYETALVCLPCSIVFQLCNITIVTSVSMTSILPSASVEGQSSYPGKATTSVPAISSQKIFSTEFTSVKTVFSTSETVGFASSSIPELVSINSTSTFLPTTTTLSIISTNSTTTTSESTSSSMIFNSPTAITTTSTTISSISSASTTIAASPTIVSTVIVISTTNKGISTVSTDATATTSIRTTTSSTTSTSTTYTSSIRPSETPMLPVSIMVVFNFLKCTFILIAQQY